MLRFKRKNKPTPPAVKFSQVNGSPKLWGQKKTAASASPGTTDVLQARFYQDGGAAFLRRLPRHLRDRPPARWVLCQRKPTISWNLSTQLLHWVNNCPVQSILLLFWTPLEGREKQRGALGLRRGASHQGPAEARRLLRPVDARPAPPLSLGPGGFMEDPLLLPVQTVETFWLLVPRGASRALQGKPPAWARQWKHSSHLGIGFLWTSLSSSSSS